MCDAVYTTPIHSAQRRPWFPSKCVALDTLRIAYNMFVVDTWRLEREFAFISSGQLVRTCDVDELVKY